MCMRTPGSVEPCVTPGSSCYRLSRALHCFRDTCARNKYRRHLKLALRTLRTLTQRRPIERAWQNTVRHMQSKAVQQNAWVTAQHQRQLEIAQQATYASREVKLVLSLWIRWRTRAGASSLSRLLNAWQVIGPVRRAIEILRDFALEERAAEQLRYRRLRCVPGDINIWVTPIHGRYTIQHP